MQGRFPSSLTTSLLVAGIVASIATVLSAIAAATRSAGPRVVFESFCGSPTDGAYSIRPDGSELTGLLRGGRLDLGNELVVSDDGSRIAYGAKGGIFVLRGDGSGSRRLVRRGGTSLTLSPNGRLLAFQSGSVHPGISIIGTNGRGLRRVSSGLIYPLAWSPDSKVLVADSVPGGGKDSLILQPLHGQARVIARGPHYAAGWSPDGRWIAYRGNGRVPGLWLVRPDGRQRHRFARGFGTFAWSPDGRQLAFVESRRRLGVVRADGRGLRWLQRNVRAGRDTPPSWSPDGQQIAFDDASEQIWVVGRDGHGLHPLTHDCGNVLRGWTRQKPVLHPDPPPVRVLDANTIATRTPVGPLSADGSKIAFIVPGSPTQCRYVAVWTPGTSSTLPVYEPSPCPHQSGIWGVELAGSRVSWRRYRSCSDQGVCDTLLQSATLTSPQAVKLTYGKKDIVDTEGFHEHGDGDLFVFDDGAGRLVQIGGGTERCGTVRRPTAEICKTLRRGPHSAPVDSVSGGLIAIREEHEVAVLDAQGTLVRLFPFGAQKVDAARVDGGSLVVVRARTIERYEVATGALQLSRPMPGGSALLDVDGGVAVLRDLDRACDCPAKLLLLRLDDGRLRTLTPGKGPRYAELEPPGLYYTYTDGSEGRLAFVPRADLF